MAIKSGRNGAVKWDPTGVGAPTVLVSLNKWRASFKTDKINVTCFGDQNKVYVPGQKDISGSLSGFWNSTNLALFAAADADTPGLLELVPNTTEAATLVFKGKAYLDADIDTGVDGAPAVSGSFMAADSWTMPAGA